MKPSIGITTGCPCGIGPEIVAKAIKDPRVLSICEPIVLGEIGFAASLSPAECGKASVASVDMAIRAALQGRVKAIVTAPINKSHWKSAGVKFLGHTEYIAHETNTKIFAMMMASPKLKVTLVTTHIPLCDVPKAVTVERICEATRLTYMSLRGNAEAISPKQLNSNDKSNFNIAICALNPHAGEGGHMGKEEGSVIIPAIRLLEQEGIPVSGPYPADTIFWQASEGRFSAVIAMYHDQGLAAIKTLDFKRTVNVTLGLPFVRTSPDHGTAEDIKGKGIASHENMVEAIRMAVSLQRS